MRTPIVLALCVLGLITNAFGAWTPRTFPNPMKDVDKCGRKGVRSWICDPDGIISYESANVVEGVIKKIFAGEKPYALGPCGSAGQKGYQVAVALMRKMSYSGEAGAAAKQFATAIHDSWGVGDPTCNNGVLFFLSKDDRQLYVSAGSGTVNLLTYDVLGDILEDVRPALKKANYDEAVERAIVDIGMALAGRAVEPEGGETPGWQEGLAFGIFAAAAGGLTWWARRTESRKRRRYQDCKSKLEKLKRDQAAMRSRSYNPTSCPICLEDFAEDGANGSGSGGGSTPSAPPAEEGNGTGPAASAAATAPQAACCGGRHGVAPAAAAAAVTELELRQPLMAGGGSGGSGSGVASEGPRGAAPEAGEQQQQGGQPQPQPPRRPLVLPCGHAFCEPCITLWLDQKKVTCPICRRPIDDDDSPDGTAPRPPSQRTPTPPADNNSNNRTSNSTGPSSSSGPRPPCTVDDDDTGDAAFAAEEGDYFGSGGGSASSGLPPRLRLRWGRRARRGMRYGGRLTDELLLSEMLFRLRQLQRQHPDYIDNRMADAWEQDLRDGRELSAQQLRDFQLRDPATRSALEASGRSGASSGFGGGHSGGGGGHGGSW